MPKVSARRLTLAEFNQAVSELRISNANIKLARTCMVDGEEIKTTAEAAGKTRQALNNVVNRIWTKHQE